MSRKRRQSDNDYDVEAQQKALEKVFKLFRALFIFLVICTLVSAGLALYFLGELP